MSLNALDALRSSILIASDTAEYHQIGEFTPQDATTNPSLVYAAITKPEYAHLVEDAVQYALTRPESLDVDARAEAACDYLLVQLGIQILKIIPGRVSISIDPRLANDKHAIITKAQTLITLFETHGYPRTRILIKIPGTYAGILACRALEAQQPAIHTNVTLIFGVVQALACAQARVAVISPFVGRVKDWWDARVPEAQRTSDRAHPGLVLLREICAAFDARTRARGNGDVRRTAVMAAGFRTADEVVQAAAATATPDVVTLQVALLRELRGRGVPLEGAGSGSDLILNLEGKDVDADVGAEPRYVVYVEDGEGGIAEAKSEAEAEAEALFMRDLEVERIAVEKVPEGLAKFAVDAQRLEDLLRDKIRIRI